MKQLREQVVQYGTRTLSTAELLLVILGTGTSTKITPLSLQHLMEDCPLPQLLQADMGQLAHTLDLGEAKAIQMQAVVELARRMMRPRESEGYRILSPQDAATLVMPDMAYLDHEEMRVLALNTKNIVVANLLLYQGTVQTSVLRAAEIFRPAVVRQCPAILVCHNHPSGDPTPSPEDIAVTEQLVEAGKLLDIEVVDHLIIGNSRFLSLKERLRW